MSNAVYREAYQEGDVLVCFRHAHPHAEEAIRQVLQYEPGQGRFPCDVCAGHAPDTLTPWPGWREVRP